MPAPKSFDQLTLADTELARFTETLGDERLLTRDQAAAFLAVSPRTIDAWSANLRKRRQRGRAKPKASTIKPSPERLPYIKLGGRVLFQLADLRAFRDARKVAA